MTRYRPVTGPGSGTPKPPKVADVRDLPCPDGPGNHELVNSDDGERVTTTCRWCGRGWGELDLEVRARRKGKAA